MKLTIVGGYHDKKVVEVRCLVPVRISEDTPVASFFSEAPFNNDEIKIHEYIPQSIKFSHYDDLMILAPHGQDVAQTIEILINAHGEQ